MGEIVEYRRVLRNKSACTEPVPEQGATILFFLGVRYERHEEVVKPPAQKRRSRTTRPFPPTRPKSPKRTA